MDGGRVVGLVSATEVFALAAHMLGVWESWCGLTLGPVEIATGTLSRVAAVVEAAGGTLKSMITIGEGKGPRRVIIRFRDADVEAVAQAWKRPATASWSCAPRCDHAATSDDRNLPRPWPLAPPEPRRKKVRLLCVPSSVKGIGWAPDRGAGDEH